MKNINLNNSKLKRALLIGLIISFLLIIGVTLFSFIIKTKPSTQITQTAPIEQKPTLESLTYTKLVPFNEEGTRECVGLCPSDATGSATSIDKSKDDVITSTSSAISDETGATVTPTPTLTTDETVLAQNSGDNESASQTEGVSLDTTSPTPTTSTSAESASQLPIAGYIRNTLILGGLSLIVILVSFVL